MQTNEIARIDQREHEKQVLIGEYEKSMEQQVNEAAVELHRLDDELAERTAAADEALCSLKSKLTLLSDQQLFLVASNSNLLKRVCILLLVVY